MSIFEKEQNLISGIDPYEEIFEVSEAKKEEKRKGNQQKYFRNTLVCFLSVK